MTEPKADPPPFTEGERAFLRWLVRQAIARKRKQAADADAEAAKLAGARDDER